MADEAVVIDNGVEVTVAHDPDGLPKTVPLGESPVKADRQKAQDNDTLARITRERDEALAKAEQEASERIEAERRARAELDALASKLGEHKGIALRAHWEKVTGEKDQINTSIQHFNAVLDAAKRDKRAIELARMEGKADPEKLADAAVAADERMAEAKAALITLNSGLSGAEEAIKEAERYIRAELAQAKEVKKEPEAKTEEKKEPKKPSAEDWISDVRQKFGSAPADWVNEHREFVNDPKMNAKLIAFANHWLAFEEKPLNDSEFIDALNAKFFPEDTDVSEDDNQEETKVETKAPEKKKQAMASAPVSRGSNGYRSSTNPHGTKKYLRPELARTAKEIGMTTEAYYDAVEAMIKDGKYPKNYLDPDYSK